MKFTWLDALVGLALAASILRGYRVGLISTIFSAIGFIAGGVLGLMIALHYVQTWTGIAGKVGVMIAGIFLAASIGENIFRAIGRLFHRKVLIGPLKTIDSIAGAAVSVVRTGFFIYLLSLIALATQWNGAHVAIPKSYFYQQVHSHAPGVISNLSHRIQAAFPKN